MALLPLLSVGLPLAQSFLESRAIGKANKKNKKAMAMSNLINALSPRANNQPNFEEPKRSGLLKAIAAANTGLGAYNQFNQLQNQGVESALRRQTLEQGLEAGQREIDRNKGIDFVKSLPELPDATPAQKKGRDFIGSLPEAAQSGQGPLGRVASQFGSQDAGVREGIEQAQSQSMLSKIAGQFGSQNPATRAGIRDTQRDFAEQAAAAARQEAQDNRQKRLDDLDEEKFEFDKEQSIGKNKAEIIKDTLEREKARREEIEKATSLASNVDTVIKTPQTIDSFPVERRGEILTSIGQREAAGELPDGVSLRDFTRKDPSGEVLKEYGELVQARSDFDNLKSFFMSLDDDFIGWYDGRVTDERMDDDLRQKLVDLDVTASFVGETLAQKLQDRVSDADFERIRKNVARREDFSYNTVRGKIKALDRFLSTQNNTLIKKLDAGNFRNPGLEELDIPLPTFEGTRAADSRGADRQQRNISVRNNLLGGGL